MDLNNKSRAELIEIIENLRRKGGETHQGQVFSSGEDALLFVQIHMVPDEVFSWEHVRIKDCNPAFLQMMGYGKADLKEASFASLQLLEEASLGNFKHILSEDPHSLEFIGYYKRKNGEVLPARSILEKIGDPLNGSLLAYLRLSPSQHRPMYLPGTDAYGQLQKALLNSNLLAVTVDGQGRITFCNKALLKLLENKERELLGENLFEELMLVGNEKMNMEKLLSFSAGHRFSENANRSIRTKSGKTIDLMVVSIIVHQDNQKFQGVTILAEDITEQKQVRQKLQESNLQLAELFNNAFDLIQIFTEKGNLIFVNKAWRDKLGYQESEVAALSFYKLIHPQYLAATTGYLQGVKKYKSKGKLNTVLLAKDGSQVHVSGSVSWKLGKEKPGEYQIIFHDISEQVKAERAQRLYNSITNLTVQSPDLDHLYFNIHRELKKVMNADNFYIALTDHKNEVFFPYYVESHRNYTQEGPDYESEKDLVDYVVASNKSHILYQEDFLELITATVIRPKSVIPQTWLGVPLTVNKRVIGIISVQNFDRRNTLDEKDMDLLDFVSGQVALAIERKRNEEKLNEQTSRLHAIFESSSHLIWSVNRQFAFTSFNQNFVRLMQNHFQVTPQLNEVYSNENQKVTNEYLKQFIDKYKRAFEGRLSQFELEFKIGPQQYIWKQIFINPVLLDDGSIHEVSGIAHDITQRKKSEVALLDSEEKFRNIFESFQDIYFRCNIDGTITMISPSIKELTDFDTSDVIGKNITNYYLYDSRTKNLIRKLVKNKSVRNFEATVINANGELLQCICNVRLIVHADRPAEIEGVARDITELKKANMALQKAKDVAEKSLKVKEAFLANMSHEIRTPMNGVISMIDVLAETRLDPQQADYVNTIKTSSETLLSILNDILDLSKIEAGKMKLHRYSVSLKGIMEKLYGLFSQKAFTKNIDFRYALAEDVPPYVLTDEIRLLQILSNLTANALKFTPKGGKVWVHLADITEIKKKQNPNTEHLYKVTVSDSGIGISGEDQRSLFQNFSQADNSSTKKYKGTGLGLAIAKQLVGLLQGEIGVASDIGQGSTFWFTFKAKPTETPPQQEDEALVDLPDIARYAPRILLVDDNEVNRKVSGEILKNAGCLVTLAENGEEAIAFVRKNDFDLILMDIQMPEMDGIDTTRAIKALGLDNLPPVVAMTAYSMQGDREKFLEAGLDDYLAKPIRAHTLIRKVGEWMGLKVSNTDHREIQNENNLQVVNDEILKELEKFGGEPLIYASLSDFEKEAGELIESCFKSFENRDFSQILSKLHTLKGSASTLGVEKVAHHAGRIEANLKEKKHATLAQDLLSLKTTFLEFQNHVNSTLNPNQNAR